MTPDKSSLKHLGLVAPFSPDIVRSPYFCDLIAGIMTELMESKCRLEWIMIRDKDLSSYYLDNLRREYPHVEGLIILSWKHFERLILELQETRTLPAILINDNDPRIRLNFVYCDSKSGIREMWKHLQGKKYPTLGVLRGPEDISTDAKERFEEFKKCAQDANSPLQEKYLVQAGRFDEDAGYDAMKKWIATGDLPRAIFCANDDLARGSIRALHEKNLRVPDDVAIAGFDDSKRDLAHDIPLTTVRQPLEELGASAVQTLLRLLDRRVKPPVVIRFDSKLVVRDSA